MKAIVIGISGATCSGKTTLALELKKIFPTSKILHQDDYFYEVDDPRHVWCEDVDHINYDIVTSLDMDRMLADIMSIIDKRQLLKKGTKQGTRISQSDLCAVINKTIAEDKIQLLFLDGFLLYSYKPLLPIITLKYFHLLDREECVKRRENRVYEPPDIPGYFDTCVWPEYLKHLEEIRTNVNDITYFSSSTQNVIDKVICDLYECLQTETK